MNLGTDFFKILNIVVVIMRLMAKIFGDEDTKKEVIESEARSKDSDVNHAV